MRYVGLNWQFHCVTRSRDVELSPRERDRLRALGLWQETQDVQLACRTFGVAEPRCTGGAPALTPTT